VPFEIGKHPTSRYSLVEAHPETGRMHQIRKHLAHVMHPIIGDRPHGCNKQNRYFKNEFSMDTMMLHAAELSFIHPYSKKEFFLKATYQLEFQRTLTLLSLK
jgi:tRNA pseudouridine65 synthase